MQSREGTNSLVSVLEMQKKKNKSGGEKPALRKRSKTITAATRTKKKKI